MSWFTMRSAKKASSKSLPPQAPDVLGSSARGAARAQDVTLSHVNLSNRDGNVERGGDGKGTRGNATRWVRRKGSG